ncbi:Pao retrotransposon peptidase [Popillia japonica]|uniref:Pao retrotransposon peptidase n=1 Tax=Popillia japonica TaxID=7064 RepID=A0AAW1IXP6_POPJA
MNTDTVSSLKSLRAKKTRLCHSLDRIVKYLDTRERDKNSNLAELNKRKDILEPILNQYENIQEQIEELADIECEDSEREEFEPILNQYENIQEQIEELADIECEDSEREEFERTYFHSVGLIDKLISDHSPPSIEIKETSAPEPSTSTVNNHSVQQNEYSAVFLSTAIIDVYDIKGKPQSCRVLLDSGSQSNFIAKKFVEKLGIRGEPFHIPVVAGSLEQLKTTTTSVKWHPSLQKTHLGWIVAGSLEQVKPTTTSVKCNLDCSRIFRTIENYHYVSKMQSISRQLEQLKTTTTSVKCNLSVANSLDEKITAFWKADTRSESGRFIVKLPFKRDPNSIGDTYSVALKRFHNLEKRLNKDVDLKMQYADFLDEYLKLRHMKSIPSSETLLDTTPHYYLPHHAVLKPFSTTTKLRVVFDGSAKSSTGISLNDLLMVGPTIQDDLFSITLRLRTYPIVLTADIAKMYRQVLLDKSDSRFQRIFWRNDPRQPVQTYELSTVTYGTASASYLAIRCIRVYQLAQEKSLEFPVGSRISSQDFYVDDLITGCNTTEEAIDIINQTTSLLSKGGFELRKWCSNKAEIFTNANVPTSIESLHLLDKENVKKLGLLWNSQRDALLYNAPEPKFNTRVTKRSFCILSYIASLFDPLVLVGPTIFIGKILIQKLWQANPNWDESVPSSIYSQFIESESVPSSIYSQFIERCRIHIAVNYCKKCATSQETASD